jgi:hypothetical protein
MCNKFDFTRDTVISFISRRKEFTLAELKTELQQKGAIFQVAPSFPVKKYLGNFESLGMIKFNDKDKKYVKV